MGKVTIKVIFNHLEWIEDNSNGVRNTQLVMKQGKMVQIEGISLLDMSCSLYALQFYLFEKI